MIRRRPLAAALYECTNDVHNERDQISFIVADHPDVPLQTKRNMRERNINTFNEKVWNVDVAFVDVLENAYSICSGHEKLSNNVNVGVVDLSATPQSASGPGIRCFQMASSTNQMQNIIAFVLHARV